MASIGSLFLDWYKHTNIQSYSILIEDPQAPGSHGQILGNDFTEDQRICGPFIALIGLYLRVVIPNIHIHLIPRGLMWVISLQKSDWPRRLVLRKRN
jgi:hypothetical protein